MHIIIGIGAAVALLYFWLGISIVRLVVATVFFPIVIIALDPVLDHILGDGANYPLAIAWLVMCAGIAWLLSGIPAYVRSAARLHQKPG